MKNMNQYGNAYPYEKLTEDVQTEEEQGFFQGSLKVAVILAGLFVVGYLLSWLIGG